MRILGVDPGSVTTGFGVIDYERGKLVLVDGGYGIYVTDHRDYFEKAAPLIESFFRAERRIPGPEDAPRTNYEAKYREEGREIYEVRFWRGAPRIEN